MESQNNRYMLKRNKSENRIKIIPNPKSRNGGESNSIFIKKFEMKLPNFGYIKIKDPILSYKEQLDKEKLNTNSKNCYCKFKEDEILLKEIFKSLDKQTNIAEKVQKLKIDLNDAERIERVLEEKELIFKKTPEIFNSSYNKSYENYRQLIYINFLKNKNVVYNFDKTTNTYNINANNKYFVDDGNNSLDMEDRLFFEYLKENFNKIKKDDYESLNEVNQTENLDSPKKKNKLNEELLNSSKLNADMELIKIDENSNMKRVFNKNELKCEEIILENKVNSKKKRKIIENDFNNVNNNSNYYYQKEKIQLNNKILIGKNKHQIVKKKQMKMVNLNENLVNNLNFEINKINSNEIKEISVRLKTENKSMKFNEKSNEIQKEILNSDFKNLLSNFKSVNSEMSKDGDPEEVKNTKLKSSIFPGKNASNKILNIAENLNVGINEKKEISELIDAKKDQNGNYIANNIIPSKINSYANLIRVTSNSNEKKNFGEEKNKLKDIHNTNVNSIDSLKSYSKQNKNETDKSKVDENIKLKYDKNCKSSDVNVNNFHSDISTNRFGIFVKIPQKDFKYNFAYLKNNLQNNTIQNKLVISHNSNLTFKKNFFRKSLNFEEFNNEIYNKNRNVTKNSLLTKPISQSNNKMKQNGKKLYNQMNNFKPTKEINYIFDTNPYSSDENKENKDFNPVSIMLKTNYSWNDKINSLRSPYNIYLSSREALNTHSNNRSNNLNGGLFTTDDAKNYTSDDMNMNFTFHQGKYILKEKDIQNMHLFKNILSDESKNIESKGFNMININEMNYFKNLSKKTNNIGKRSKELSELQEEKTFLNNSVQKLLSNLNEENKFDSKKKNLLDKELIKENFKNSSSKLDDFNNNNSISNNNTQLEPLNFKRSFLSNSNRGNSNVIKNNNESPNHNKNLESILNNTINLNELFFENLDMKQSLRITSQNGKKQLFCLNPENRKEIIAKNSNNKAVTSLKKNSKLQIFKELIKAAPLPLAMENFNSLVKFKKVPTISASHRDFFSSNSLENDFKSNSVKKNNIENFRIKDEFKNRYRKKKINIEDVLIHHNANIRRQLNPVKTKDFHMKCSIFVKDKVFGLKRTTIQNCFNKSETFKLKRENLINFEKPFTPEPIFNNKRLLDK